jgi:hypothetical protein
VIKVLKDIRDELEQVVAAVTASIPNDEPISVAHGNNWSFPGITRAELLEMPAALVTTIDAMGSESVSKADEAHLADFPRRLAFLRTHTVQQIWGNSATGVPTYQITLDALRKALERAAPPAPSEELVRAVKRVTQQVRAMEARLKELEPRSANLADMVQRIEFANEAADRLPTDLEALNEAQQQVDGVLAAAAKDGAKISELRDRATEAGDKLETTSDEAAAVLARCESAYSAATSQGLAAAFSERSRALGLSMAMWVAGLIVALVAGAYFGSNQLQALTELAKTPGAPLGSIVLNLLLALLSVGAPVWFAWLATKQIGQRFRLSEDYAFKASISRAYEGYRREAARIDKDMEARLLASALDRLDELPLRLVEAETHGSPWHELASSNVVRDAVKLVPGFTGQVTDLANKALAVVRPTKPLPGPEVSTEELK